MQVYKDVCVCRSPVKIYEVLHYSQLDSLLDIRRLFLQNIATADPEF